jgi:hypothetical protein
LHVPLKLGAAWLAGTYVLFLVLGEVGKVPDLFKLTMFIVATIAAFIVGYLLKARSYVRQPRGAQSEANLVGEVISVRRWVLLSSAYLAVVGVGQLVIHGVGGPAEFVQAILHPGAAYFARIGFDAGQSADQSANAYVQVLTLLAGLSTPVVPFAILYWKRLAVAYRSSAILGIGFYASYWLYIGTIKGLGDVLLFALAAIMVLAAWREHRPRLGRARRQIQRWVSAGLLLAVFIGYMSFNQSDRLTYLGVTAGFEANPVIASITSEEFARGLSATAFYPTHGYLGLAYNLDTPFTWSRGLGASRALDSYWAQYGGGRPADVTTYSERTEVRAGWSAGLVWATIYPWLASDLSFPGAVLFMGVVGWWLARFWYESIFLRSKVAILMFCQLILLLGYVPANNQIGITRPGLIAFVSLTFIYAIRQPGRARRSRS